MLQIQRFSGATTASLPRCTKGPDNLSPGSELQGFGLSWAELIINRVVWFYAKYLDLDEPGALDNTTCTNSACILVGKLP